MMAVSENAIDAQDARPALPVPLLPRWQPLRLGLTGLYHFDSEEFWFRDGHLLLRGNNGSGKSKILSLTLPFLLDARLLPSRIEPDGDRSKRMGWNLLQGIHDRRIGYAWIEFGRRGEDGQPHYLTLGAGLSAVAARAEVESWYFMLDGQRVGRDLWLMSPQRRVLTREHLREAIGGNGQMVATGETYRRLVDERLFGLGPRRYEALMDTLIQLRQPQLSKKPDEALLSEALTEALPPLPPELLADVAEAMNQLEEDRRQLDEFRALAQAVERFEQRYRLYTGIASRRQARALRQAETGFENASFARNRAAAAANAAQRAEELAEEGHRQAEASLAGHRERLDVLQADPTMQDANRLEQARSDHEARENAVRKLTDTHHEISQRLERETSAGEEYIVHANKAESTLSTQRGASLQTAERAGLTARVSDNPLVVQSPADLADLTDAAVEAAEAGLRGIIAGRRESIRILRQSHMAFGKLRSRQDGCDGARDGKRDDLRRITGERDKADEMVVTTGDTLIKDWAIHMERLEQLRLDPELPLSALVIWVAQPDGNNPARQALAAAQYEASLRHAAEETAIKARQTTLLQESGMLEAEGAALAAGEDTGPPIPYTRSSDIRSGRDGAPLWKLVDFRSSLDAGVRAGLEAALEASGLLDAWVAPGGILLDGEGGLPLMDSGLVARPAAPGRSLADWLRATVPAGILLPESEIDRLLAGIACDAADPPEAEAWVSPDGRFRLGSLAGAWNKAEAVHIGLAARMAAREKRLEEIANRLAEIGEEKAALIRQVSDLSQARRLAEQEWSGMPSDGPLLDAHRKAVAAAQSFIQSTERLAEAEAACRSAKQAVEEARNKIERDAIDLGLPPDADALPGFEATLNEFDAACFGLGRAVLVWRQAWPQLQRQRKRVEEAGRDEQAAARQLTDGRLEASRAKSRYETLRNAVGAKVQTLHQQLDAAKMAVEKSGKRLAQRAEYWRKTGRFHAVAKARFTAAAADLDQAAITRSIAVAKLQSFAASGFLSSALPDLDLPDLHVPWTIDPALTLARRAEQALAGTRDDDDSWSRVQKQIGEDHTELNRALGALGHQSAAELNDFGLAVHLVSQNRPERPDTLLARLIEEIAQRGELLSAQERVVLENHLQAEIAAEIQRLLRSAEQRLNATNAELHKRPTSTGVRFRLQWLPLTEAEGAPPGLEAARARLLSTSHDLWSAEDRRLIGAMFQHRIEAERARADAGPWPEGGGLIDLLGRALDYRRWHGFRVQRHQDGQWRKLSGPASSGERALGLTVPLFAAIAGFYAGSGNPHAPRLILLDEAFAGIDDAARAHCMGLIREFDLDFVITSEREWACYAELPGVSICHLQRRDGINAVHVSRWSWDGRARRREEDPDNRLPPA